MTRPKIDIQAVSDALIHKHHFVLWPKSWEDNNDPTALSWDFVRFDISEESKIPETPGLYAFIVQPKMSAGLQPSYLMYVGQTSNQTLRKRFRQYVDGLAKGTERPKLVAHLPRYAGFTYFHFAEIPIGSTLQPKQIEEKLLNGFVPPLNTLFTGTVSQAVRAFT